MHLETGDGGEKHTVLGRNGLVPLAEASLLKVLQPQIVLLSVKGEIGDLEEHLG